jgi:cysteine-rich repeat protein
MSMKRFGLLCCALLATACGGKKSAGNPDGGMSAKIDRFTANQSAVAPGGKVTLSWTVETGAVKISIDATPGGPLVDSTMLMGMVTSNAIEADTLFQLTVTDGSGRTSMSSVMVKVDTSKVTISKFEASPNPAPLNGNAFIVWEVAGATKVRVNDGDRDVHVAAGAELMAGMFAVTVDQPSLVYTLFASNDTDMAQQSVTLTGELPAEIHSFRVTPLVWTGATQDVMVSWTTVNAPKVTLTANGMPATGFTPNVATGTVTITIMTTTLFELTAHSGGGDVIADAASARATMEMEPNNDQMHANPISTGAITGMIDPATDVDYFSFTVPDGGHVLALTQPINASDPCYPTQITLWSSTSTVTPLGVSNDSVSPPCSVIDPSVADDFAKDLPGGTYFISVDQGPLATTATQTGSYALVVLTAPAACGNGILEKGEDCDNGTSNGPDAPCSTSCKFNFIGEVMAPGGMVMTTLLMMDDIRLLKITTSMPGQGIEVSTKDPSGQCTVAAQLQLFDPMQNMLGTATGDGMGGDCGAIRFPQDAFATNLAVGTYILLLQNNGMTGGSITIDVNVRNPACGNGALESLVGEQCDDGNTTSGDGCSSTCTIEPKAMFSGPGTATAPATMSFLGTLPAGRRDYYQILMSAPGYIMAETGVPTVPMCTNSADTKLDILDSTFHVLGGSDDISMTDKCTRIAWDPSAPYNKVLAGTYYIDAYAYSATTAIAGYQLAVKLVAVGCGNAIAEMGEQCDDGNTTAGDGCSATCQLEGTPVMAVEPNNDAMHATPSGATKGKLVVLRGALPAVDAFDFWSFVVPTGQTVTVNAITHTTLTDPYSCAQGTDTVLTLLDAAGNILDANDDISTGSNLCSLIDGAGAQTGAANLTAGTYYLKVESYMGMVSPTYFLNLRLE